MGKRLSRQRFLIRGAIDKYREKDGFVHIRKGKDENGEQQMLLSRAGNKCWGYSIMLYQLNADEQARAISGPQLVEAIS